MSLNGELNGTVAETMDTNSHTGSTAAPTKQSEDSKDSLHNYNHCDDLIQNEDCSENSNDIDNMSDETSNLAENTDMDIHEMNKIDKGNNIVPKTVVPSNNECNNSNGSHADSVDSSQLGSVVDTEKKTEAHLQKVSDADSGANDEESECEEDSEEDSSEEDGSVDSEGPRAEDTVSINSDSDLELTEERQSTVESQSTANNQGVVNLDKNLDRNGDKAQRPMSPEIHEIDSDDEESTVTDEKSNSNQSASADVPCRRSSRAVKRKNYAHSVGLNGNDESDMEVISADSTLDRSMNKCEPIVVKDTKALVEMASKQMKFNPGSQKKEPTVVIIDTNSAIPSKGPLSMTQGKMNISSSIYADNLYQSIAARGTTVTPVHSKQTSTSVQTAHLPIILPSLTDDMYVVEAPSFIVPYVYEKPSVKAFREFVDILGRELEKQREKEEAERSAKEKLNQEKQNKEMKERGEAPEKLTEESTDNQADTDKPSLEASVEETPKSKKQKKDRKRHQNVEDDASWDGQSSSDTEDEAISDDDQGTMIVIKDKEDDSLENIKNNITADFALDSKPAGIKTDNYFDNALGNFFSNIGANLVQEYVQADLLKQQKRKLHKELKMGGTNTKPTEGAIISLSKNLEFSKENNAPYSFKQRKCKFCSFKTESMLVMAHHMETPHMKNNVYSCNFCTFEIKSPHDILYHMEEQHNTRGRLERAPAYHQCANCPFEDNGKGKLARHLIPCAKKFKPELNLAPPVEWEPPAKIPKMTRARNSMMSSYQAAFNRAQVGINLVTRPPTNMSGMMPGVVGNYRGRGRSPMSGNPRGVPPPMLRGNMLRHNAAQLMPPAQHYPILNPQGASKNAGAKLLHHQPSISITPLPRAPLPAVPTPAQQQQLQQQQQQQNSKGSFVICEICDGYIKDLMTLRNHLHWIHNVKIHIKMIYNRPPLNCQKCQFRFFTDQGLERHLLGSHGLVTSSMQEAANKGKDAGRCPVCGRVYQWKLLNHVARDHNLTLKPAHLSYKCTVCTATFGMYKQFENHVYSAHSVVAKKVMDKSKSAPMPPKPAAGDASLLKPLKINDEITIIPQPSQSAAAVKGKRD